jgi:hypothetical protein
VHLVYEEQGTAAGRARRLADLAQQVDEVLLGVARVRHSSRRRNVELQLDSSGADEAEGLHDTERPVDPLLHAVSTAHLAQQPRGHLGEGRPEVRLRPDLLHVGRRPPGLGGEDVELEEEDGLPYAAQPVVHEAAVRAAAGEDLDERAEVLEIAVPAGEVRRFPAGTGGVGVVPAMYRTNLAVSKTDRAYVRLEMARQLLS